MYITICDDDGHFISYIKRIIIDSGADRQTTYFDEYTSGSDFILNLESKKECDLLILDMQFGDMNGDDVAKKFREIYPYATLVFCSGVQQPTVKSFKATPFRYLLKSYSDEKMVEEMKEILNEVNRNNEEVALVGHYRYNLIKVLLRNIMYITNTKRGSRIFVSPECNEYDFGEQILVDSKLTELYEKLERYGFEFVNKSYLVNMRYVRQIVERELVLYTDEKLSVSRNYYKEFREKFAKMVARKY